jgi:hypothetical protein
MDPLNLSFLDKLQQKKKLRRAGGSSQILEMDGSGDERVRSIAFDADASKLQ